LIFFDWKKVQKLSGGKTKNVVRLLAILTYDIKMPRKDKNISQFYNQDISGDSYLLNPREIFKNKLQVTLDDMALYIELASLRNYLDYKWYGVKSLPLKYTEIDRAVLRENPLLEIDGQDNITFYYEGKENGN
jgi:hypothetical protein|tara:strand:+ start:1283 stop:1681 length:399 start_codon:yes stop_codon:yes gene_type:complete